jgi:1,4-alpha-glucan branching enzyme
MSITKKYQHSKNCKVTFRLAAIDCNNARTLHLVGDFNEWDKVSLPMAKDKNGNFLVSIELQAGAEYQFRYLANEHVWLNDPEADKYIPTIFGDSENSVIII